MLYNSFKFDNNLSFVRLPTQFFLLADQTFLYRSFVEPLLERTNGCLTKCRLDLQPPLVRPRRPTPNRSHPHQKTKSINSTPSLLLSYVCLFMSMLLAFLPTDSVDFVKQTPSLSPRFGGCLQFAFLQMDHSSLP